LGRQLLLLATVKKYSVLLLVVKLKEPGTGSSRDTGSFLTIIASYYGQVVGTADVVVVLDFLHQKVPVPVVHQ
jgi:hypothetical protein